MCNCEPAEETRSYETLNLVKLSFLRVSQASWGFPKVFLGLTAKFVKCPKELLNDLQPKDFCKMFATDVEPYFTGFQNGFQGSFDIELTAASSYLPTDLKERKYFF